MQDYIGQLQSRVRYLQGRVAYWRGQATYWRGQASYWKGQATYWKGQAIFWKGEVIRRKGQAIHWKAIGKGFSSGSARTVALMRQMGDIPASAALEVIERGLAEGSTDVEILRGWCWISFGDGAAGINAAEEALGESFERGRESVDTSYGVDSAYCDAPTVAGAMAGVADQFTKDPVSESGSDLVDLGLLGVGAPCIWRSVDNLIDYAGG